MCIVQYTYCACNSLSAAPALKMDKLLAQRKLVSQDVSACVIYSLYMRTCSIDGLGSE